MKVLAGIVLFNPDIDRLKENIDAIYCQVNTVVLVNNGSENFDKVQILAGEYKGIRFIDNKRNLGIATALKQMMDFAIQEQYDWVLTLDQDSVCQPGLIEKYSYYVGMEKVGILTCNIVDRNFSVDSGFKEDEEYREIKQCITSASLVSVAAYRLTDGFDEKLFIDSVDFDICINMRKHGFKIIKVNFNGILHEVGHGKNVKLLFKNYVSYNHSPFRQYYMARNQRYLVKKYPDQFSKGKEWLRELRIELIIVLYEKDKMKKLRKRWKGIRDVNKLLEQR
jgi:eps11N